MNLNNIPNDKMMMYGLIAGCVALFLSFAIAAVGMKAITNSTTDAVIEKLQRYTPGPYHPAFDPDKVSPDLWRQGQGQQPSPQQPNDPNDPWHDNWTKLRH